MKKILYIISLLVIILFIIFGIQNRNFILPNTYYQVYLDGKLIGKIKSRDRLEKYINEQGNLVKNQVLDYKNQIEVIDNVENMIFNNQFYEELSNNIEIYKFYKDNLTSLINNTDDEGNIIDKEKIDAIEKKKKISKNKVTNYNEIINEIDSKMLELSAIIFNRIDTNTLSEVDKYNLDKFVQNKYYEIKYSKIIYMRNYIEENKIYEYAKNVYKPLGITIKRINTYNKKYIDEKEMYNKIISLKPCTIEGYQFRIKRENNKDLDVNTLYGTLSNVSYSKVKKSSLNDMIIYTTDKEIFDKSIDTFIEVFVGKDEYEKYKNNEQEEIVETGTIIKNVELEQEITMKKTNISVKEKIFTSADDLSSYLLYGDNAQKTIAYASSSDTISSFAFKNQISVEEFFLFNRDFTSINNMFYDGQPITISRLNPQISLIVDEFSVEDKETNYNTIERYNPNLTMGSRLVSQEGQNGVDRVSQNVRKINGAISYVEPVSKETIVGYKSEIVDIGTKYVPTVGSTGSWGWPTNPGYTLSSYYGYRMQVFGEGNFHTGLDIAGTGYGSNVYASNNGVIVEIGYVYSYGYHIMINHNNGYYTLYAHMSGFAPGLDVGTTVSRGQTIGYVGQSGWATGPHLHFEIRNCASYGCTLDPLPYLMMR